MLHRRKFLGTLAAGICGSTVPSQLSGATINSSSASNKTGFKYCLNTSTIRGQKLGIWKEIEIASKAGYDGIELWVRDIRHYLEQGGKVGDLRKKIEDSGLVFENAIAFSQWIVDDPEIRKNELVKFRDELDLLESLGCRRIAAPPSGATKGKKIPLESIARRYANLLDIANEYRITPVLEIWGFSENLSTLAEALYVLVESKHPEACMLPDIYHLHRGGSAFSGLRLLSSNAISMFHLNDYPDSIPGNELIDADRVFPGDGSAPLPEILSNLKQINPEMVLSLELFNPDYWKMDALQAASTGLKKMNEISDHHKKSNFKVL